MKGENSNGSPVPGTEELLKRDPPTILEVRKYLKTDLALAIMLLESVYKDEPTMHSLADFLHGRFMNARHKAELERQKDIFSPDGVK